MTPSKLFSFDAGNWDRYVGRVASFAGKLAFVGKTAVWNDCLYAVLVDPREPAAARVWSARTGAEIVDVDAVAVSHADKESLAVGVLTGHKEACPICTGRSAGGRPALVPAPSESGPAAGGRTGAAGGGRRGHRRQYLDEVYGPRAIRLVQGGIDGSSPLTSLDNLQVFYQNGGLRHRGFIANILSRIEVNLSTNALSGIGKDWLGDKTEWKEGLTLDEVNFQVFPVLSDRPDLRNGSYTGLGQYVYVDSMKNAGTGSPDGVVSAFRSDTLVPVKTESVEGQTLDYPVKMEMSNDPATWDLLGVIYGPPPFSLQGSGFNELKKGSSILVQEQQRREVQALDQGRRQRPPDRGVLRHRLLGGVRYRLRHDQGEVDRGRGRVLVQARGRRAGRLRLLHRQPAQLRGAAVHAQDVGRRRHPRLGDLRHQLHRQGGRRHALLLPLQHDGPGHSVVSKGMRKHRAPDRLFGGLVEGRPHGRRGQGLVADQPGAAHRRHARRRDAHLGDQGSGVEPVAGGDDQAHGRVGLRQGGVHIRRDHRKQPERQAKNTEAVLALDVPKKGAAGALAQRLEVETYWMQADSTNAYWVPEAFRSNGNYQKPWCIDYRVRGWEPYKASAESVVALGVLPRRLHGRGGRRAAGRRPGHDSDSAGAHRRPATWPG